MFDVFYPNQKPNVFSHEKKVNSIAQAQQLSKTRYFWWITYLADFSNWDFLWEPPPWQAHQRHAWASQWQKDSGTYLIPKSWSGSETQYRIDKKLVTLPSFEHWQNIDCCDFDYTWHPDPSDPPYIHEFGTQWWDIGGPRYVVPNSTEIKYQNFPRAVLKQRQGNCWQAVTKCEFDYSWQPHPNDPPYIYIFGNQWWPPEKMPTVKYHVPGAINVKYVYEPKGTVPVTHKERYQILTNCDFDFSWTPDPGDPPFIYVFGNQWHRAEIMPSVLYHAPGATEKKYMDWPVAIQRPNKTNWQIPDSINLEDVDLSWIPDPGAPPFVYQFGTQHQKTGGPVYTVPGATEIKYVENIKVKIDPGSIPIFEIDHLDGNAGKIVNTAKTVRFFDNYRDTLIRVAKSCLGQHEWIWVCSSICDYNDFDFSWHPESWQSTMLHVFPSNEQKFGDTFYMHVPTFAERAPKKKLLEWYSVHFVSGIKVARHPLPTVQHDQDTHADMVKNSMWHGPAALFCVDTNRANLIPALNFWRKELQAIMPLDHGARTIIVPRVAVPSIKTQLYDYKNIDKSHQTLNDGYPLDIVFISNGELQAEQNLAHLSDVVKKSHSGNKIHHVQGVNGRVAAYHAAAQQSSTAWFFAVFAKLKVDEKFNWSWQPDRMQQPKHYIFHALNPVNNLVYGHQAMIAYNKKLVLKNTGVGLDFTLDSAHEVVPLLSGIAHYTDSPWMAWRTAFREVIKLRYSLPDIESEYRLNQWLKPNNSNELVKWSHIGAQDAMEYYDSVNGDLSKLRLSYEWIWLAKHALMRRGLTTDRLHIQLQDR